MPTVARKYCMHEKEMLIFVVWEYQAYITSRHFFAVKNGGLLILCRSWHVYLYCSSQASETKLFHHITWNSSTRAQKKPVRKVRSPGTNANCSMDVMAAWDAQWYLYPEGVLWEDWWICQRARVLNSQTARKNFRKLRKGIKAWTTIMFYTCGLEWGGRSFNKVLEQFIATHNGIYSILPLNAEIHYQPCHPGDWHNRAWFGPCNWQTCQLFWLSNVAPIRSTFFKSKLLRSSPRYSILPSLPWLIEILSSPQPKVNNSVPHAKNVDNRSKCEDHWWWDHNIGICCVNRHRKLTCVRGGPYFIVKLVRWDRWHTR